MRYRAVIERVVAVGVSLLAVAVLAQCTDSSDPLGGGSAAIAVSPVTATLTAVANGPMPEASTVKITNGGNAGSVTGATPGFVGGLAASIAYQSGGATGWLEANLSSVSDPADLTLRLKSTRIVPGTHNATVTVSGKVANSGKALASKTITVTAQVDPGPAISVATTSLDFTTWAGGPDPSAKTTDVSNTGIAGSTLDGLVITTSGGSWLRASINRATAPATVSVAPAAAGLAAGNYVGSVVVGSDVTAASRTIAVAFNVTEGPKIALAPSAQVTMDATAGVLPPAQTLTVTNSAGGALTGLAVGAVAYGAGATGWLEARLDRPTAPAALTLQALPATSQLSPGTYTATIPITSTVTSVTSSTVTVTLRVASVPSIVLSPTDVVFQSDIGGPVAAATDVSVTSGGGGTLSGLAVGAITYGAGATGWLSATLNAAQAPTTLVLRPSTTAITAGTYTAKVQVTSSAAGVVPKEVNVSYTLRAVPVIGLSAATATFAAVVGGSVPLAQVITISNAGSGSLGALSRNVGYQGAQTGWLVASLVQSGSAGTLTLQPSTTALPLGTYTASVDIAATAAGVAPVTVQITYTVGQAVPTVVLNPPSLSLTGEAGPFDPTVPGPFFGTVAVTNAISGSLGGLSATPTYGPGGTGWLTTSFNVTTTPATMTVYRSVAAGQLAVGTYSATVRVASTAVNAVAATLTVTYVVTPVPCIAVSATSVTFNTTQFTNPPPQEINVTNGCGNGTLDRLYVELSELAIGTLAATVAPTTLTIRAINASIPAPVGQHTGTVWLRSQNLSCCAVRPGKPIAYTINVSPGVGTITITPSPVALALGGTVQLTATVQASTGVSKTVTWTSSNTTIATVSNTGLVITRAKGTVTITATSTVDQTKQGLVTVTVQ